MKLPDQVIVGTHTYRVRGRRMDGLLGQTDLKKTVIEIDRRSAPSQRRLVLLHELLHAVIGDTPLTLDRDAEEEWVRSITPGLLAALRDNSDLVSYLLEE